jgi:peptide/nickel transport system substrate-binding protein
MEAVFKKRDYDLSYWLLAMGPDPAVGTARLYLTSQIRKMAGVTNGMSYSNPEVDRLFGEAAGSPSREAAGEKYKQIQKLIVQDMPCLWILDTPYIVTYSSKLEGLPDSPWNGVGKLAGVWWNK